MTPFLHHRIFSVPGVVCCALLTAAAPASAVEPEPGTVEMIKHLSLDETAQPLRDQPQWRKPDRIGVQVPGWIKVNAPDAMQRFRRAAGGVEVVEISGASDPRVAQLDAIVGLCSGPMLKAAGNLRWLLSRFLRRAWPTLKVIANSEVPDSRTIKVTTIIGAKS